MPNIKKGQNSEWVTHENISGRKKKKRAILE